METTTCEICDRTVDIEDATFHPEEGVHECDDCKDARHREMERAVGRAFEHSPAHLDAIRLTERDAIDTMR